MLNQVYRDEDVSLDVLQGKTIAVLGYGIQGGPQALCMRDSGLKVIVGADPRDRFPDWDRAVNDGFEVYDFAEATRKADVVQVVERVLKRLLGRPGPVGVPGAEAHTILVAHDLSPADVIQFKQHRFGAFITMGPCVLQGYLTDPERQVFVASDVAEAIVLAEHGLSLSCAEEAGTTACGDWANEARYSVVGVLQRGSSVAVRPTRCSSTSWPRLSPPCHRQTWRVIPISMSA